MKQKEKIKKPCEVKSFEMSESLPKAYNNKLMKNKTKNK
jgi:hypothetical protein